MPHITFRNINHLENKEEKMKQLASDLAEIADCNIDFFTFSFVNDHETYSRKGCVTDSTAFCEVKWYPRAQEVQDKVAAKIGEALEKKNQKLIMNFVILEKSNYYRFDS